MRPDKGLTAALIASRERGLGDSFYVPLQAVNARAARLAGLATKTPGRNCRAGRNYRALREKKGRGRPGWKGGPVRPYRKKDRMELGAWFAMESA